MDTNISEKITKRHASTAVLTVDELAAYLRLDRKAVYDAIHRGEIPGVQRIGRCYRISRVAITRWLSGRDDLQRASQVG